MQQKELVLRLMLLILALWAACAQANTQSGVSAAPERLAAGDKRPEVQLSHSAQQAFSDYSAAIFQVRLINLKSQNPSSSGTGFFVGDGLLFATNYHVIASVVLEPQDYKAVIEIEGQEVELVVVAVDVVNDLALLEAPFSHQALKLKPSPPKQGEKLYSIGNPHNIGMTIVEGNYNGLAEDYVFDRIHFSGAINSGMSGGPTINKAGEVVGINVQTGGNQVGFLVPVDKLRALLANYGGEAEDSEAGQDEAEKGTELTEDTLARYASLRTDISEQTKAATSALLNGVLDLASWPRDTLVDHQVVGKLHSGFNCWGKNQELKKKQLSRVRKGCNSRQFIFISRDLTTGFLEYEYELLSGESWPSDAFYRYASGRFEGARASNKAGEKDVENFRCVNNVLAPTADNAKRKVAYCTRAYKRFSGLSDTLYMAVSLDANNQIIMEHFFLSGVDADVSRRFLARFVEENGGRS